MRPKVDIAFRAAILAATLTIVGCTTAPKPPSPTIELDSRFAEGGAGSNGNRMPTEWWRTFRDDKLNAAVEKGLVENLDVQQAVERISAAEAGVTAAGAGGLPYLTANFSGTASETTGAVGERNIASGGANLTWLLDFFGLYKHSRESAIAGLDEARARADFAKLSLISQISSAYINLRYFQQRLAITEQDIASRRETLNLTRILEKQGQGTKLDVVQAQGLVSSTLAQIPDIEVSIRRAAYRIDTLVGSPISERLHDKYNAHQPSSDDTVQAGVPADLIRNRPDIRAAEKRLTAEIANIGVAEAQLYPSITLGGSISPSYASLAGGLTANTLAWSFGPTLNLPIFDGGKLKANLNIAESNAKVAYLAWKATALGAVEEVQGAIAAVRRDVRTVAALRDTVNLYQQALTMSMKRYQEGESSLLEVLDAQRSVSQAKGSLSEAIRQKALNYISLNVAIGRGNYEVYDNLSSQSSLRSHQDLPVDQKRSVFPSRD